jgi:hypothetical protein
MSTIYTTDEEERQQDIPNQLIEAVLQNNLKNVKYLIKKGATINTSGNFALKWGK